MGPVELGVALLTRVAVTELDDTVPDALDVTEEIVELLA